MSGFDESKVRRDSIGKFTAKAVDEQEGGLCALGLSDGPGAQDSLEGGKGLDLTIAGTSRVYDMQREYSLRAAPSRPPIVSADDTVAHALQKWQSWVVTNMDDGALAQERGWTQAGDEDEAAVRDLLGSRIPKTAVCWDTSDDPDSRADVTFVASTPKAKPAQWRDLRNGKIYELVNPAAEEAAAKICADVRAWAAQNGFNTEQVDDRLIRRMLAKSKKDAAADSSDRHNPALLALGGSTLDGIEWPSASRFDDSADYAQAKARWDAAALRLMSDPDAYRAQLGVAEGDDGAMIQILGSYRSWEYEDLERRRQAHVRDMTTRIAATAFVVDRLGMAEDTYLQGRRHAVGGHSATVWEDKKHIPATHVEAAARSTFRDHGMGHVEIDESVDLDDFRKVEKEWAVLSGLVPHTRPPSRMAFRLTGRHRASGVYSRHDDAIAVDPRSPSAMWHEYVHHLDASMGERDVSLSDGFRPILRRAQQAVADSSAQFKWAARDLDYYRTPTEVHSRAAELWLHWSGVATSLNGDSMRYDADPAYSTLYPQKAEIMEYFDKTFGSPQ